MYSALCPLPTRNLIYPPSQSPEQMLVVVQVQAGTNLVTPMAIDCAQTAGFNLELALAKFRELQVSRESSSILPLLKPYPPTATDSCTLLP